jgi:lipopolysaccharide transport system permease protein
MPPLSSPTRARLEQWGRVLAAQRAGLRLYQWLWLLLCVVAALVVVTPRLLSQPVVYQAVAEARFDEQRYSGLYAEQNGVPQHDLQVALGDATETLRQRTLARRDLRFGSPTFDITYVPREAGSVYVQGIGSTAQEARQLANAGAEELIRQVRAAGGREVLRNLLGWEMVAALHGEATSTQFQQYLRDIIENTAFPMSRPIEPVSERINVGDLPLEEQRDLARALEARYDLWTFAINQRNSALDAACNTQAIINTAQREQALQACAEGNPAVAAELAARNRAIQSRRTIETALRYLLDTHSLTFEPDVPAAAYRVAASLPQEPVARHSGLILLLAAVLGLAFGAVGVAVDRAAGVMPKLRELWTYRELVRNMILRDLRTRYKNSTLGYVWTQLAPLLMMLIFLFVFTLLIPQGIALFPVFLIVALLPWNFCAEAVMGGTRSVIDNANLINKVFFPREVLPLTSVLSSLVNYLLSLPMMFLVMAVTQWLILGRLNFSWTFAYLPVVLIVQTLFLVGVVFFLSALAVFFRDTVHLIGILIQFWFFLTPIFYSLDIIGEPLARVIRWINPMASLVDFYRDILYGNTVPIGQIPTPGLPALDSVLRVVVTTVVLLALGYWFFQRNSGRFGEEL